MAWNGTRTWTTGEVITSTIATQQWKENMDETAVAKAAAAGDLFVATGANALKVLSLGAARKTPAVNAGATDLEYIDSLASLLTTQGDIAYASSPNTPIRLGVGDLNYPWRFVKKAADETVNNSATFQNDDDLLFAVAANEVWAIYGLILLNSGTTPDFKGRFTSPTGAAVGYVVTTQDNPQTATLITAYKEDSAGSGAGFVAGGGNTAPVVINGVAVIGGTGGNVTFQWAQNTADASNTVVDELSYLMFKRLK